MRVVIIGGVAGGTSLAARLRRLNEDIEIILLERGAHIAYASCGLPYYIGGVIKEEKDLYVQTPESMKQRFGIEVRTNHEIISIDRKNKKLYGVNVLSGEPFEIGYDKLVLSTGTEPIKPQIPGIDSKRVLTIKDIPDTLSMKQLIDTQGVQNVLVVGGGFIGLEVMENLIHRGLHVTLADASDQLLPPIDYDMAVLAHQYIREKSVRLKLNSIVKKVTDVSDDKVNVDFNNGGQEKYDLVLLCIGVRPNSSLAVDAGLKTNQNGTIYVDDSLKTTDSDIYAVGDIAGKTDLVTEDTVFLPLAGPANRQGRLAADVIAGRDEAFDGVIGTSIVKVFDMTIACTGKNEKQLVSGHVEYEKIFLHPFSHASYYPGATPIDLKLLFNKESGKIYGAQAIGFEGVDKRIDVIATLLKMSGTVADMEKLELCYAPPFSSARDPVVMAGMIAHNIVKGDTKVFQWHDVESLGKDDILLDVRTLGEYRRGWIKDAIHIPVDVLRKNIDALPRDKRIFIYCKVGLRGYIAQRILIINGYKDVYNLSGGYLTYNAVERERLNERKAKKEVLIDGKK